MFSMFRSLKDYHGRRGSGWCQVIKLGPMGGSHRKINFSLTEEINV